MMYIYPFYKSKNRKRINTLIYVTMAMTVLFIVFDTYMTQVMATRYTLEFSFLLFLISGVYIFELWEQLSACVRNAISRGLLLVVMFSVVINLLTFFTTPQYPLNYGNTEMYYRIFYLFQFLWSMRVRGKRSIMLIKNGVYGTIHHDWRGDSIVSFFNDSSGLTCFFPYCILSMGWSRDLGIMRSGFVF